MIFIAVLCTITSLKGFEMLKLQSRDRKKVRIKGQGERDAKERFQNSANNPPPLQHTVSMTHHYFVTPRISETNLGGHIGGVTIPVWFEEARFAFFRDTLKGADFRHFVVRYEVDFKKEIFYGAEVEVQTVAEKIGNSSIVLSHDVCQNSELCATGKSIIVYIDKQTRQATPIPKEFRVLLQPG